jgi:glycolate oxidase FAD binding subunit
VELFDGPLAGHLFPAVLPAGGTLLAIRFAGLPADCAHSAAALLADLAAAGSLRAESLDGAACDEAWRALDDLPGAAGTVVRVVAPPSAAAALLNGPALPAGARAAADLATGVLHLLWPEEPPAESLGLALKALRTALSGVGQATLWKAPAQVRRQLDVWGPPPASYPLMLAVKQALDPRGLWNPGRFLGEL